MLPKLILLRCRKHVKHSGGRIDPWQVGKGRINERAPEVAAKKHSGTHVWRTLNLMNGLAIWHDRARAGALTCGEL